jgi:hypothetical protein
MSQLDRNRLAAAFDRELARTPVPPGLRSQAVRATLDHRRALAPQRQPWALALVAALLAIAVVAALALGIRALQSIPARHGPPPPVPRLMDATMAFDSAHGQMVLFGTASQSPANPAAAKSETWIWQGGKWTELTLPNSPAPRVFAGMAYDEKRGQVVLFGGQSVANGGALQDTWTWDGSAWTEHQTTLSPPACGGTILVNATNMKLVIALVDACDGRTETWAWDGNQWIALLPSVELPGPRSGSSAAFDPANGTVVVFSQQADGITWTFNGKTWTRHARVAGDPPGRDRATMAFDPSSGKVVLFGGAVSRGTTFLSDTWLWDGKSWTQAHPAQSPQARDRAVAVTDTGARRVVLYGGQFSELVTYSDVWIWAQGAWTLAQPQPTRSTAS